MSFVRYLNNTSNDNRDNWRRFSSQPEMDRETQLDALFNDLTTKHYGYLLNCLDRASTIGKREAFVNFPIDDFTVTITNTGNPKWVCKKWLKKLVKDDDSLTGIRYNVWGNDDFTTKFFW